MLLISILGIWAIISVITHIPGFPVQKLNLLYDLGLAPQWNFFAPNPPKGDFILLYRDRSDEDMPGGWTEIQKNIRRPYTAWLWNPHKRTNKASFDLVNELISIINEIKETEPAERDRRLFTAIPYLALSNHICRAYPNHMASFRQFAILSNTAQGYQTVFTSNFHQL